MMPLLYRLSYIGPKKQMGAARFERAPYRLSQGEAACQLAYAPTRAISLIRTGDRLLRGQPL